MIAVASRPIAGAESGLLVSAAEAVAAIEALAAEAAANLRTRLAPDGKLSAAALDREQHAAALRARPGLQG